MAWWNEWLKGFNNLDLPEEQEQEHPLILTLKSKGYEYDVGNDWYERTWTTNGGEESEESIREIYQQLENGEWNKLMIGYGDTVFYEEKVDDN